MTSKYDHLDRQTVIAGAPYDTGDKPFVYGDRFVYKTHRFRPRKPGGRLQSAGSFDLDRMRFT